MEKHSERCKGCRVRARSVCEPLPEVESERLNEMARIKFIAPGGVIVKDNDKADYFATIVTGTVKLTKELADGRQQIVGVLHPSDFIGRPFRSMSPYKAEAITSVQLCAFERTLFEKLIKENREFDRRLFDYTLAELDGVHASMLLLSRKSAQARLASFLVTLANRSGATCQMDGQTALLVELPLSRHEIAEYLGLTVETVSRQFTQLKLKGLIGLKLKRKIIIKDIRRLAETSERQCQRE